MQRGVVEATDRYLVAIARHKTTTTSYVTEERKAWKKVIEAIHKHQ